MQFSFPFLGLFFSFGIENLPPNGENPRLDNLFIVGRNFGNADYTPHMQVGITSVSAYIPSV
eukprot:3785769-Rhodomonas_salina.3